MTVPVEVGVTGLSMWAGRVHEEWITALKPDQHFKIYQEMECDSVVNQSLKAMNALMRQVPWRVEAEDRSESALNDAQFVQDQLDDLNPNWPNTLSEILSMLVWGYSWHEIVLKRNEDGSVGWKGFPIRAQTSRLRWELMDNGDVLAFIQQAPTDFKERRIPRDRSLHFLTASNKGNPEGVSMLRGVYKSWYFKSNLERLEGIGYERNAAGIPIARVPSEVMTDEDKTAQYETFKKLVTGLRRDDQHGAVLPSDTDEKGKLLYDLQLLSPTGGLAEQSMNTTITRHDQRIAQGLLSDVLLLGHEKVGSFALADSKTNMMGIALGSFLDVIGEEISDRAIPQLMELNGRDSRPRLVHGDIESQDLGELGEFITKISSAGAPLFPDPKLEAWLRDQAGMPQASEDVEQISVIPEETPEVTDEETEVEPQSEQMDAFE